MAIDLKAALANPANAQKFTNDLAVTLTNVRFSEEQCAEDLIEPPGIRGELADGYGAPRTMSVRGVMATTKADR